MSTLGDIMSTSGRYHKYIRGCSVHRRDTMSTSFQIYNLFREIFKFREDKSNNVFREILKCFRKTVKFEFFAKQIIYLESPDRPLQNDI